MLRQRCTHGETSAAPNTGVSVLSIRAVCGLSMHWIDPYAAPYCAGRPDRCGTGAQRSCRPAVWRVDRPVQSTISAVPCNAAITSASSPMQHTDQQRPQRQQQQEVQPHLPALAHRLGSTLTAAALAASLLLLSPAAPPAHARARMTAEEQLSIDIFKRSTPSVVNVTNLAVKRDSFTMNMMEVPQVGAA